MKTEAIERLISRSTGDDREAARAELYSLANEVRDAREGRRARETFRAHFAAHALEGMLASGDEFATLGETARQSWRYADAMLEARDEKMSVDVDELVGKIRKASGDPEFKSHEALIEDLIALVGDVKAEIEKRRDGEKPIGERVAAIDLDAIARHGGGRGFSTEVVAAAIGASGAGEITPGTRALIERALLELGFVKSRIAFTERYEWRRP